MSKESTSKASQTDWTRVDALQDEDIDLYDNPELTPEMFARAIARKGLKPLTRKQQVTLRIDGDVLQWFNDQGRAYQSRINALPRAYMEALRTREYCLLLFPLNHIPAIPSAPPRCHGSRPWRNAFRRAASRPPLFSISPTAVSSARGR